MIVILMPYVQIQQVVSHVNVVLHIKEMVNLALTSMNVQWTQHHVIQMLHAKILMAVTHVLVILGLMVMVLLAMMSMNVLI